MVVRGLRRDRARKVGVGCRLRGLGGRMGIGASG